MNCSSNNLGLRNLNPPIELQDGKGGEANIKDLECAADSAQLEVPSGRVLLFPASLICAKTGDEK